MNAIPKHVANNRVDLARSLRSCSACGNLFNPKGRTNKCNICRSMARPVFKWNRRDV